MRPGMIFRVDEYCYNAVASDHSCKGCVGEKSRDICDILPFCTKSRIGVNLIYEKVPLEKVRLLKNRGVEIPDMTGKLEGDGVMVNGV
ncbi:MAG: hypothetical protein ACK5JU_12470 [Bacteroidales bacterium]